MGRATPRLENSNAHSTAMTRPLDADLSLSSSRGIFAGHSVAEIVFTMDFGHCVFPFLLYQKIIFFFESNVLPEVTPLMCLGKLARLT